MTREAVDALERDNRLNVKLLKARHRIERDRTGWRDGVEFLPRSRGAIYADHLTGRRFDQSKALVRHRSFKLWRGWRVQIRAGWLGLNRFRNENIRLYQGGPFVLYGPGVQK